MADRIDQRIQKFQPQVNRHVYEVIRNDVIALARASEPRSISDARRAMTMLNGFVSSVYTNVGGDLTADALLRPSVIIRYLNTDTLHIRYVSRFDIARFLGTLTERLTGRQVMRLAPPPSTRSKPYTNAELGKLVSWAGSMNSELQARNAWALLALGAGCGLTAAEIASCRRSDVELIDGIWWVNVSGERARRVPARRQWASALELACDHSEEYLFHGYRLDEYPPRMIQSFVSDHPAEVRLSPLRLRSGWIVGLIDNGVPPTYIAALAGLANVSSLNDYFAFAAPSALTDHLQAIVGGREVTR
ncbi:MULTISPECIES: site-specific integrase [unclassified Curtobacterium]|uniref:site-specific integrase n=1 Tax=unclassified Curtobacterium TaxID=257496 RepID=UPI0015E87789|nr:MULTISPECIES: site-specific integrase [unclassified Curtobacterium]